MKCSQTSTRCPNPALDGTILPGITRDSLIAPVKREGKTVTERGIEIGELLRQIKSGACSELFACGTAAIVSPIRQLVDADGTEYAAANVDSVASRLRESLLSIHEQRASDTFGWTREVG